MTDIDQLGKIFAALGTPNADNWPGGLNKAGVGRDEQQQQQQVHYQQECEQPS